MAFGTSDPERLGTVAKLVLRATLFRRLRCENGAAAPQFVLVVILVLVLALQSERFRGRRRERGRSTSTEGRREIRPKGWIIAKTALGDEGRFAATNVIVHAIVHVVGRPGRTLDYVNDYVNDGVRDERFAVRRIVAGFALSAYARRPAGRVGRLRRLTQASRNHFVVSSVLISVEV